MDDDVGKLPLIPGLRLPRYFIADTGAPCHMTSSRHALYDFQPWDGHSIRMVNDDSMEVQGVGLLDLLFLIQDDPFVLTLDRVLFVEGLANDLFSLRVMDKAATSSEVATDPYPFLMGD